MTVGECLKNLFDIMKTLILLAIPLVDPSGAEITFFDLQKIKIQKLSTQY